MHFATSLKVTSHFWARLPVNFCQNQLLLRKRHLAISSLMKRLRLIRQGVHSLFLCLTVGQMLCEDLNIPPLPQRICKWGELNCFKYPQRDSQLVWSPVLSHLLSTHSASGMSDKNTMGNGLSCGGAGRMPPVSQWEMPGCRPGAPTHPRECLGARCLVGDIQICLYLLSSWNW